jgi:PAS domain S-box-containing protein
MASHIEKDDGTVDSTQVLSPVGQPLFQSLIEHSVDAIALVDSQGKVLYLSPSIQRLLGYTAEELLGRVAFEFVHPDDQEKTMAVLGGVIQRPGASLMVEYRLRHKDGSWRWMEATATNMLHNPHIGAIIGNFHDITERKRVEFLLEGQSRVLEMVAQGAVLPEALEVLVRLIEELSTHNVLASILLLDEDGVHLRYGAAPSLPDTYNAAIDGIAIGPAAGSSGTAAYTKQRVIVSDIANDPLWTDLRELALSHGLRACWSTPILSSTRQVLGTFALYYRRPYSPSAEDRQLIDFLIRSAAIAIERKRADDALRASEAKFRRFFDSHIIGAFVSTFDGLYLEANDVLLDMIGYTREDLLAGKVHRDTLTSPAYDYVSQQAMRDLREIGFTHPYEKVYLRKDGTPLPILVAVTRIDPDREICMGFVLDRSEAKALEKRRDEFISMASHELKTPVTSLIGYTQLLRNRFQKRGDEDSVYLLTRMDVQLHRLTKLINDLLDVPRAQAGQLAYREEQFDLLPLMQEVVGNMQEVTKSHRLILEGEGQVPAPVYGDRDRLGQVLTNLLINAIKYSPHADQVYIRITTEPGRVIVSVQDFGIGIADAHHKHLFERFYRASDAEVNTYPGLGIGLYISREIIKRHQGDIWFESRKGEGSTFSFALPLFVMPK